ncbi:MAG: FAD-dependent oxidoreductase [Gemmatimonadetes bacterium]|nr:FAD-dependent oxidoreductase [Gemmatimonadota bacterium]
MEMKRRDPGGSVTLLEKEAGCGRHASGRNSGVLHAGFYYGSDTLKARFCVEGNRSLTEYCDDRGLPIRKCGKLVVAKDESEVAGLEELHRRGQINGVELSLISESEAKEIDPRVSTFEKALYSPSTSSVDPGRVVAALLADAREIGVEVLEGIRFLGRRGPAALTSDGTVDAGYVINAAGLQADRVGKAFGFSEHYTMLPFKGLYLWSSEPEGAYRTHIYPVPDLRRPFLGVHITVNVDGVATLGPTAAPAFWRENYGGLSGFDLGELAAVIWRSSELFIRNTSGFRNLALDELPKLWKRQLVRKASHLAIGISARHFRTWGAPGIRAQLLDTRSKELVMDFYFEGDDRSFHVLNAVSPGFTCALPFSRFLVDEIEKRAG